MVAARSASFGLTPGRGEIWNADLNPTRGYEQAGKRPVLVISTDIFNEGPADLVVVLPITSKGKGVALHVQVEAEESGLKMTSYVLCDAIRSIAKERLLVKLGSVDNGTLEEIEERLRILLDL
jgi:mRNA interferase MazF